MTTSLAAFFAAVPAARLVAVLLSVLLAVSVGEATDAITRGRLAGLGLAPLPGLSGDRRYPALPADASAAPLAQPAPAPSGSGGYVVLEHQDDGSGRPVRWDPCRPIHYVIRARGAPPGGDAAVSSSVAELEQITGLRFQFDGYTDESPVPDRRTFQPSRYGDRWAPVLVAWTGPREYPPMAGYAGLGGPDAVSGRSPGQRRFVSGVVLLNRDYLIQALRWDGGREHLDAVVLHEFGHLAGLDHVNDPAQLMYRQPTPKPGGFADGDRRGLAALAGGPCFTDY